MGQHDGDDGSDAPMTSRKRINAVLGSLFSAVDRPVTYVKDNVEKLQSGKPKQYWYHRQLRRVPTADQCEMEDRVCLYEADEQYIRDREVDINVVRILRQRLHECQMWEGAPNYYKCDGYKKQFEDAMCNWFIKYGEMRYTKKSLEAYMKQKHRLIWERRHPDNILHDKLSN